MDNTTNIDVDTNIPPNAVSLIDDGAEEFPVLKAFQQYINAEQDKARKRMLTLCIFFGALMTAVILVFLFLLNGVSRRNEMLNDRLLDYMMKKDNGQAAVVVQPPADNSAVIGLVNRLDEMQKQIAEAQSKAAAADAARVEAASKAVAEAREAEKASRAAQEKARIKEELEIARLKAELAAEREKAAQEHERKHQAELEAYRRKYYPELYEGEKLQTIPSQKTSQRALPAEKENDDEIDALLDELSEDGAINYFEEEDEDGAPLPKSTKSSPAKAAGYSIPVEIKGNKTKWRIPNN